jgi:hypothetical protein
MDPDFLLDAIRALHAEVAAQMARNKANQARLAELERENDDLKKSVEPGVPNA